MVRGYPVFFSLLSLPHLFQKKVAKQEFTDIDPIRVGGTPENNTTLLPAPDLPLAFALRGADVMWSTLFTFTFLTAVALSFAAVLMDYAGGGLD